MPHIPGAMQLHQALPVLRQVLRQVHLLPAHRLLRLPRELRPIALRPVHQEALRLRLQIRHLAALRPAHLVVRQVHPVPAPQTVQAQRLKRF